MTTRSATAIAHPNIALAKYWGKRDVGDNVPATPSLSMTLAGLETRTTVTFDDALTRDELRLNDAATEGRPLARVVKVLDEVRRLSGMRTPARVVSRNDFPTASGLASSASGFAALTVAACGAAGLDFDGLDDASLSRIARRASASAARSVFGGFVALGCGDDPSAEPIAPPSYWPLRVVVGAVTSAAKAVGSTEGMEHTRRTSPYYRPWLDDAPLVEREIRAAIAARDLERLGTAAEASALRMHACALAASPALLYWTSATIDLLDRVRQLRKDGVGAWATIDAGPHVKVVCAPADAEAVERALRPASRTTVATLGDGARIVARGVE